MKGDLKDPGVTTAVSNDGKLPPSKRLGIVFDIDGTIIAENHNPYQFHHKIQLRPETIEFMRWCKSRGHSLALWTKAHSSHAMSINHLICKQIDPNHVCWGKCRHTFSFVWDQEKLRRRTVPSHRQQTSDDPFSGGMECRWCEAYSKTCQHCTCHFYYRCPCMDIKDLRYIWHTQKYKDEFTKERTIIVENTPQNCIYNYGNAIYVPTYSGFDAVPVFARLKKFIAEVLEECEDVRKVKKCNHGQYFHACYEQSWISTVADEESKEECKIIQ